MLGASRALRTMIRPWGCPLQSLPQTSQDESVGKQVGLWDLPQTYPNLRARSSVHVFPTLEGGTRGPGGHLARSFWPHRPCQVQVVPPTSCRDTPADQHGQDQMGQAMTVHVLADVGRSSVPSPDVRELENSPASLPYLYPTLSRDLVFLLSFPRIFYHSPYSPETRFPAVSTWATR